MTQYFSAQEIKCNVLKSCLQPVFRFDVKHHILLQESNNINNKFILNDGWEPYRIRFFCNEIGAFILYIKESNISKTKGKIYWFEGPWAGVAPACESKT